MTAPPTFDIDLVLAVQRGDTAAFADLYRRHSRAVLRYAWAALGERGAAEDALQDTFVVAWNRRGSLTIVDESALPWLLATCRNHVRGELRHRRRHPADALDADIGVHDDSRDDLIALQAELSRLSPIDRRVCELCLGAGFTYREAAALLDSTETAVGKRLQRARERLRRALVPDIEHDRTGEGDPV